MTKRRGKGEGSIYRFHRAKDGCPPLVDGVRPEHKCRALWAATIEYGSIAGRRDRKVVYGKTKADVLAKVAAAKKAAPPRRSKDAKIHTVSTWLDEWLDEIATKPPKAIKPQTKVSHRQKIETYLKPLIGKKRLDRLEPKDIRRAYARMQEPCPSPNSEGRCPHKPSHGLSESTTRQTHAILHRALKIAVREGLVAVNESDNVEPPGTSTNEREKLSTTQARLVLNAAADDPYVSRWYAALQVGLRQGEALGLTWGMVDLGAGTLSIERTLIKTDDGLGFGTPKSKASRRTIVVPNQTLAHLKVHRARVEAERGSVSPGDLVWCQPNGNPIGHKADWEKWRDLLSLAGVPHVALHSARQTAGAWMEETGAPARLVAEILGHSNVQQTYNYQRSAGLDRQRVAIGELG